MERNFIAGAGLLTVAIALAACSSSSDNTSSSSSSSSSGSSGSSGDCKTGKNAAWASPAGTPFALPSSVTAAITGDDQTNCPLGNPFEEYGNEGLFMCLGLTNSTASNVTVSLPAGLTFVAKKAATANGIILQSHDLTVPTGTTYFKFALFDLNKSCAFDDGTDTFTIGNVSNDSAMAEIISLAQDKPLSTPASDSAGALTLGIWDITDGDGLTDDHRTAIQQTTD